MESIAGALVLDRHLEAFGEAPESASTLPGGLSCAVMGLSSAWRRALATVLAVAGLVVGGGSWLFSGATVDCAEGRSGGRQGLSCELLVAAPRAEVWDAFVGTGAPRPYYFNAVLQAELEPGGRWRFVTEDGKRRLAGGRLVALDPPRRLEQTFAAADLDDPASRIVVELHEVAEGTRVHLIHDGFPRANATYRRFRRAHPLALSAMRSVLETGRLPWRARIYTALFEPGMKLFTPRAEPWGPELQPAARPDG